MGRADQDNAEAHNAELTHRPAEGAMKASDPDRINVMANVADAKVLHLGMVQLLDDYLARFDHDEKGVQVAVATVLTAMMLTCAAMLDAAHTPIEVFAERVREMSTWMKGQKP